MYRLALITIFATLCLTSCSSSREGPQWSSTKKRPNTYRMATRQIPPQPVYGATTWVRPPQMAPNRKVEASDADVIQQIVKLDIKDRPLSEVVLILAATARYRSYCSSKVAKRRLTISSLGTLSELAMQIEDAANITVVVDHANKEVRFLPKSSIKPNF